MKPKQGARKPAPRGSGLHWHVARGVWYWRRVDRQTGKRLDRNTGQHRLDLAMRVAARFEDELREKQAGVKNLDHWRLELEPLIPRWLESQDNLKKTLDQKDRELRRALEALKLRVAADLTDVAEIDARLRRLERVEGVSRVSLRRQYQEPLKAFARWLSGNGRHLPHNPLAAWESLPVPRSGKGRRAALPDEVARAFLALDLLDRVHRRLHPQRTVFLALLIAGPRAGALTSRDVRDLDLEHGLIDFGEDVGNKRRGAGALDQGTVEELRTYVGGRKSGPLFLSAHGERYQEERLLDVWREAFSLGVVAALWPADAPADFELALVVSRSLLAGKLRVSKGGNPRHVKADTLQARAELGERVERLCTRLRMDWSERMTGVVVHALRHTHQTWAEAAGVPPALIDRQLGHAGTESRRSLEVLRAVAGSRTGRASYLDMASPLLDPRRSAEAVRQLLDEAEARLRAAPGVLALLDRAADQA